MLVMGGSFIQPIVKVKFRQHLLEVRHLLGRGERFMATGAVFLRTFLPRLFVQGDAEVR